GNERILTIFQKTRALMFAYELCEGRSVRLPIHREAFKVSENSIDARLLEESDGILGIFVEVGVEYSLIHEIRITADVEENPSQVVKPERGRVHDHCEDQAGPRRKDPRLRKNYRERRSWRSVRTWLSEQPRHA